VERRRFLGLAAGGGLAGAMSLTGCGGGATGGTTLTMVAADYGDSATNTSQTYWNDVAGQFKQKNPDITVNVKVYSWDVVDKKVADMVAAGNAPDIAQCGAYADYAARGLLYSVDELLSIPAQADFISSMSDAGSVNRTQYGMPFVSSARMLFYNKTLFKKAGIVDATGAVQPPQTWDDIKSAAQKLKAAGVKVPFGLPFGPEEPAAETLIWMLGNGGNYTDDVGSYTINSAQNIEAFQWIKANLSDTGLSGRNPATTNRQDVFNAFAAGDCGFLNGHPTLMQMSERNRIDYGIAKIPGKGGPLSSTVGVADWMMAFRKNGNKQQIGKFLEFAYGRQNTLRFLRAYDLQPVTVSASNAMLADSSLKPVWPFLNELPNARFYPDNKVSWGPVNAKLKQVIGKAATQDPVGVLGDLQRTAEAADNSAAAK
jgi:multiple sugar transport system substrate-binding protein